jgi:hypothetical protein
VCRLGRANLLYKPIHPINDVNGPRSFVRHRIRGKPLRHDALLYVRAGHPQHNILFRGSLTHPKTPFLNRSGVITETELFPCSKVMVNDQNLSTKDKKEWVKVRESYMDMARHQLTNETVPDC